MRVAHGSLNAMATNSRLEADWGEVVERGLPGGEVADRVLDVQGGHDGGYCTAHHPALQVPCRREDATAGAPGRATPAVPFDAYAWLLTDPETSVGSSPLADVPVCQSCRS